jgi:hypothetical protein
LNKVKVLLKRERYKRAIPDSLEDNSKTLSKLDSTLTLTLDYTTKRVELHYSSLGA